MSRQIVSQDVKAVIVRERLRQARHSFNIALTSVTVCSGVGLWVMGLVVCGQVPIGAVMMTGSVVPIALCMQLARGGYTVQWAGRYVFLVETGSWSTYAPQDAGVGETGDTHL